MFDFLRVDLLMPLLQASVVGLITYSIKWVAKKTKISDDHWALATVKDTAKTVVASMAETTVKEYKATNTFNAETAKKVKDEAIARVIEDVGPKVVKTVKKAGHNLTAYVSDLIEEKLSEYKLEH